jgi:hypothetical protein
MKAEDNRTAATLKKFRAQSKKNKKQRNSQREDVELDAIYKGQMQQRHISRGQRPTLPLLKRLAV